MNEYTEMDFRFLCVFFTLPRALGSSPMLHSLHPQSGAQVLLGLLAGGARSHRKTVGGVGRGSYGERGSEVLLSAHPSRGLACADP